VVVDGGGHAGVSLVIGVDVPVSVSGYCRSIVVESVGEEEEVAFVGDLGEEHT